MNGDEMNESSYRWKAPSCPRAVRFVSDCVSPRITIELTDEVTGPSWADVPFAVKLTPLGALSLTSRAAVGALALGGAGQLKSRTCGGVVEVLVDKLEGGQVSNCALVELFVGSQNIRRSRAWRCR
jgi:hypothetical protein